MKFKKELKQGEEKWKVFVINFVPLYNRGGRVGKYFASCHFNMEYIIFKGESVKKYILQNALKESGVSIKQTWSVQES